MHSNFPVSSIHVSHDQDVLEVLDQKVEHDDDSTEVRHGGDVESEVHDNAEIGSKSSDTVTEAAAVEREEDIESPSEKAARMKQEAKLAAEKAQAEAKEAQKEARIQQAAEKVAAKVKEVALSS